MRVTVTTADGERFEAEVANLADGAFFLKTERTLRFRTRLSVELVDLTVRGEVVVSARDPQGVLVAFTLEPAQRMFFAALVDGVPVLPEPSAPTRPSSAPARVAPVTSAAPARAEPTPVTRRPPPRVPSIGGAAPTPIVPAGASASLGPGAGAAALTPSGTRGGAAVAAIPAPPPTITLVPASETPARGLSPRSLPPPPTLGLARPVAPGAARASGAGVDLGEPANSANDRTPLPKAPSTLPSPIEPRVTLPSPLDRTAPPRGSIPHGPGLVGRAAPPRPASSASARPASGASAPVGSGTGPIAIPSLSAGPRSTSTPGAPTAPTTPPRGPSSPSLGVPAAVTPPARAASTMAPPPRSASSTAAPPTSEVTRAPLPRGGSTLGEPRLPELRGAEIRFETGADYRAQFRTNISFGGIVVRSAPMAVGSFHPLALCVPGLAPLSLRARVGFNGDGTVGFMIDAFAVEKARFEALLEQLT
jgi:hypothetical protein